MTAPAVKLSVTAAMNVWKDIASAPKDGRAFLAYQGGEVFVAQFTSDSRPRLTYRTHTLHVQSKYRVIDTEMDGERVKALVEIDKPWPETFRHDWTLWECGFEFAPTLWAELPR